MATEIPTDGVRQAEALRRAHTEMEGRLRAGEPWDVRAFLDAHPDVAADPERVVDLLLAEYLTRRQLGEALDPLEWFRRFPRWDELARRRLAGLQTADGAEAPVGSDDQTQDHHCHRPANPDEPVPELGRHEVYEEIGRGAMGVVFRARDLVLNRPVALKMIVVRQGVLETPDSVRRFYREARAAARLRHPHIVPIHGMGLHRGRHCFTMPLLTGGSLAARAARFQGDPAAAAALVEKIARAVQAAHDQGVIHRDLKPGNILLDEHGEPFVADFGLAKLLDSDAEASMAGVRVGTPAYMAPEQAAGHTWKVSARSDVWALGVVLYELLTGRRPFAGTTTEGVFEQVMTAPPAPPRDVRPGLPADLERVVLKCLEKDAGRRYATAAALADDLARPAGVRPPDAAVAAPKGAAARRRFALLGLAAALLLLVAVLWRAAKPAPAPAPVEAPGPSAPAAVTDAPDDLAALRRAYEADGRAELVGPLGPPHWYRWQTENRGGAPPFSADAPLYLTGFELVLMQLLPPDPDRRAFRLEAEIRHEQSNVGWVGLYLDGAEPTGRPLTFSSLVFADAGRNAGRMEFRRQAYRGGRAGSGPKLNLGGAAFQGDLPARPPADGWRKVVLEVRPEEVRFRADGAPEKTLPIPRFLSETDPILSRDPLTAEPPAPPPFDPGGAIGLYVESSNAWFRNVVVEPLP